MKLSSLSAALLLTAALFLGGCGQTKEPPRADASFYAMDTQISLTAYGAQAQEAVQSAEARIRQLEAELSVTDAKSDIARLNAHQTREVSADTADVLSAALRMARETEGALDPTVYPLVRAWGFTTDAHRVPTQEEIDGLLPSVGYQRVSVEGTDVTLPAGMEVDLGAIAKGYTGQKISEAMKASGISSALLNLGGNVQAIGAKPDGSPWRIGLQAPWDTSRYAAILFIKDRAVVTSGSYQRYFIDENGVRRHHIIDPATGYPASHGAASVTIVAADGTRCDALSTALFVMGPEKAIAYWRAHKDFGLILITEDRRLLITEDLLPLYAPPSEDPLPMEVIQ